MRNSSTPYILTDSLEVLFVVNLQGFEELLHFFLGPKVFLLFILGTDFEMIRLDDDVIDGVLDVLEDDVGENLAVSAQDLLDLGLLVDQINVLFEDVPGLLQVLPGLVPVFLALHFESRHQSGHVVLQIF